MARLVLDTEERHVRDNFRLRAWFSEDADRRNQYFMQVRNSIETFRTDEGDPSDRYVQRVLAIMLENDGDLVTHVANQTVAERPWKEIWLACAGMILEAYIREIEDGTWP